MNKKPLYHLKSKIINNFFKLCLFSYFLLFVHDSLGQSITWQREFPQYYGVVYRVQQTYDGGYITVGTIRVSGSDKMRLMKFSSFGDSLWSKIIGVGSTAGYWIEETTDRGFIIGGSTDSGIGNLKVYLLKTDSLGNFLWQKIFNNSETCYSVKQTPDGGYILSCRDAVFIKTDQNGNMLWVKTYGSLQNIIVTWELQILQDGYIVTGSKWESNIADVYVMRLNLSGDTLWTKKFGGNDFDACYSIAVVPPPQNGFILGGTSKSFSSNGNANSYVVKIDNNGNLEWQRTYSSFGGYDVCESIIYKPTMGYIIAGTSDSLNMSIVNKGKIRKIDFFGNVIFETSFLPGGDETVFKSVNLTMDGGLILGGYAGNGYADFYIVKTDSLGFANPIGILNQHNSVPGEYVLYQNYPNPFNPSTKIIFDISGISVAQTFLSVYDIQGKEVVVLINQNLKPGSYEISFDASGYSSGVYFYKLVAETSQRDVFTDTKKMVLIK